MLLSAVSRVGLPSLLILTAMLDLKSLNTSLLEVIISCKTEDVFICDLSDLTLQIIFDGWWASMNVSFKHPLAWNNLRHASLWWFYLHCGIEETGSPGIICIICHQVLRHQSEHGTSSMGKHLLAKAHITKLNKLTEWEVTELTCSTAMKQLQPYWRDKKVMEFQLSVHKWKFTFHFRLYLYWLNWQTKRSKLAAKDFDTAKFHRDTRNHYPMLGFVSVHIPWNTISNLELQWSYNALRSEFVLPSASTLSNICRREFTLTVDAIKKQLLSRNKCSLPLDRWTSMNKLAITLVIASYMERNWALRETQLAFDEVDSQFFSLFER